MPEKLVQSEKILTFSSSDATCFLAQFEKDIGQVWRQMGIMYGQVSNSIAILEKVSLSTPYVLVTNNKL